MSGLTIRGRCLIAAGAAALLCSIVLGEKDLMRVAILLLALPLVSAVVVARTRFRLTCRRVLLPDHVAAGERAEVQLTLENVSLLPTAPLQLEDELPYALGGPSRFLAERTAAGRRRQVSYSVRSDLRGRFRVGPLRIRFSDPFGLVEITRSFTAIEVLTVVPAISPLPAVRIGGAWSTGGSSSSRSVSSRGEDDAATREYRHGDDLRKVHGRSTARTGNLMVRREERPWQARASLLLDTRGGAHRGDAPESSFEWAVSTFGSIGVHLLRRAYGISTVVGGRQIPVTAELGLLDRLAEVRLTRTDDLDELATSMRAGDQDATMVAVLGLLTTEQAQLLAGCRAPTTPSVAILVESTSWLSLSDEAADRSLALAAAAGTVFATAGWRVVHARRGDTAARVWGSAGLGESGLRATFMEQGR
ncbi:MAG: DUF58 domain-containing protein [Mycobacteriales bacterium]